MLCGTLTPVGSGCRSLPTASRSSTTGPWLRRPPTFPERACRLCGQAFTPTNGRQRFCSIEHWDEYQRQHRPPQTAAGWRQRVHQLETELALMRERLADLELE